MRFHGVGAKSLRTAIGASLGKRNKSLVGRPGIIHLDFNGLDGAIFTQTGHARDRNAMIYHMGPKVLRNTLQKNGISGTQILVFKKYILIVW